MALRERVASRAMRTGDLIDRAERTLIESPSVDHWQKGRERIEAEELLEFALGDLPDEDADVPAPAAAPPWPRRRHHVPPAVSGAPRDPGAAGGDQPVRAAPRAHRPQPYRNVADRTGHLRGRGLASPRRMDAARGQPGPVADDRLD